VVAIHVAAVGAEVASAAVLVDVVADRISGTPVRCRMEPNTITTTITTKTTITSNRQMLAYPRTNEEPETEMASDEMLIAPTDCLGGYYGE
jgi:hypothetical protein